ncbi:MAG TPA: hypothetical protein VGJ28_08020 [Micromonosporaceae bacterium]|jgi:ATP-dependent Clp protease ATP-binding subunit ClpA
MALSLTRRVECGLIHAADEARAQRWPEVTTAHMIVAFLDDATSIVGRAAGHTSSAAQIRAGLAIGALSGELSPYGPLELEPAARLALLRAIRDAGHRNANTADVLLAALAYPPEVVAPQLRAFGIDLTGLIAAVRTALDLGEREDDGGRIVNLPQSMTRPRHENVQLGVQRFIVASPA